MKRQEILETACDYVTRDRAADHGNLEDNFKLIAEYWSLHLNCDVAPDDVGVMMALLKIARTKGNAIHMDNYIDCAGYMACAAEIAERLYDD